MGIDQKLLTQALFMTLCLCLLLLSGNTIRLFASSPLQTETQIVTSTPKYLDLWEEADSGVYVLYPFTYAGFNVLKQFLTYTSEKRLLSFEIINGKAKVIFDEN